LFSLCDEDGSAPPPRRLKQFFIYDFKYQLSKEGREGDWKTGKREGDEAEVFIQICEDPEPYHFWKLDPNPHQSEKPDPHQSDADQQHWLYSQI